MKNKKILILLFTILILNLIWEFLHFNLYIDLTGIPLRLHSIGAAFVDVFLVSLLLLSVSIKNKNILWIKNQRKTDYFLLIILGFLLAFFWELMNLSLGRWEYTEMMPTIFSVGLSPLLQLPVT